MSWKRYLSVMIIAIFAATILTGCFTATKQKSSEKSLRYSVGAEPQTLDPRKSTGLPEATIQAQIFEGLTALSSTDLPVPAASERWTISPDGKTYIFSLRSNGRWSNGDPVTAHDFYYAWTTALSPALASEYAYQLYYIKNGEAFNKGDVPVEALGIKVINDLTLEVTLEYPTAYFLSLVSFHTYYPVHKKIVETNPNWATDPKTVVGNGPFVLTNWIHNSKLEFAKNNFYYDINKVKLDKLEFIITESAATELALFENNQLDIGDNPPPNEFPRLMKENKLTISPYLGTYFFSFNVTKAPFDDVRVRKAFSMAIDRESIIQNITKGQQRPALAWVPYGLPDSNPSQDFRETGGNYLKNNDIPTARKFMTEAGYPEGRGFPEVTLIYNTNEMHKAIAEAVQEMWKKNLGVSITLTNQEWKVFLDNRHKGFYQIARHGWIGDYADPMTFIDMFMSDSGNNDAQYKNPAYDKLVKVAKLSNDPAERMTAMHDAEKILFEDAVIAPVYFYTRLMMVKPNIKGYSRSVLGTLNFKEAYIE